MSSTEERQKEVSVVIPLQNAERYIETCLEGILDQSYPPTRYEVIVVDNNSTDRSLELVKKYPQVQLLSEAKRGAYAARNRGVKAATGRVLAFTDADCLPSKDWLRELTAPLISSQACVVQGGRLFGRESPALSMLAAYEAEKIAYSFSPQGSGTHFGYTNNMAVRREVFDRCGPFLEIPRGADSVFLDRVVSTYSARAVRFAPAAAIRHLEITSIRKWLLKKAIYGNSFHRTRRNRQSHNLTPIEVCLILQRTIERGGYARLQAAALSIIVCSGALSFSCGRIGGCLSGLMGTARGLVRRENLR